MIIKKIQRNRGFVILFAVVLSSIILAIALGVLNIALQETKFGTSAKATNDAFYAADTAAECTLYNDKFSTSLFVPTGPASITCLGFSTGLNKTIAGAVTTWSFVVSGLGPDGQGCANMVVSKDSTDPANIKTKILSKAYNSGYGSGSCSPSANAVERELEFNY